jgi:hypothetical protein
LSHKTQQISFVFPINYSTGHHSGLKPVNQAQKARQFKKKSKKSDVIDDAVQCAKKLIIEVSKTKNSKKSFKKYPKNINHVHCATVLKS